jgi:hypothetical protein
MGYRDGRLGGVGEHDDMVVAGWLVEVAIQVVEDARRRDPEEELVGMEELGIERVRIGDW